MLLGGWRPHLGTGQPIRTACMQISRCCCNLKWCAPRCHRHRADQVGAHLLQAQGIAPMPPAAVPPAWYLSLAAAPLRVAAADAAAHRWLPPAAAAAATAQHWQPASLQAHGRPLHQPAAAQAPATAEKRHSAAAAAALQRWWLAPGEGWPLQGWWQHLHGQRPVSWVFTQASKAAKFDAAGASLDGCQHCALHAQAAGLSVGQRQGPHPLQARGAAPGSVRQLRRLAADEVVCWPLQS